MKSLTTFLMAALTLWCTTACSQQHSYNSGNFFGGKTIKASNNFVTKDIRVGNFEKISIAGGQDVIYKQQKGAPSVVVYTSDNIIDLLDIQVKDNTLQIGFKKNTRVTYDKLEVRVSSPDLSAVSIAGSGDFIFTNGLTTEKDLKINIAGSGNVKGQNIRCTNMQAHIAGSGNMNIEAVTNQQLKASISGSGDMNIKSISANDVTASITGSGTIVMSGAAQEASFSIAGSGDLFADGLETKKVSTSIAGSGDIKCFATDFLKVRTSGSGSVGYKGNPQLDIPKKGLYRL